MPLAFILLAGCSEAPKTENAKKAERAPQPVTGRQAFQMMYPQARRWAVDAQPLELRSINLPEVSAPKGKAGAWQAIFVSASLNKARMYTYSAVEAGGSLHEGVFGNIAEDAPAHPSSAPFEMSAIRIDSDQAYEIAAKKSQEFIQKHPKEPVSFLLEQNKRFPEVSWRVIWGASVGTSEYSVFVGATSGEFLAISH